MKRILITGATGLVGQEIVKQCHAKNIAVSYLSTSKDKLKNESNYKGFYWNPETKEIDGACFDDVEAIINLAGASIAKRWTAAYKKEILDSRIQSLNLMYNTIQEHNIPIKQLASTSAIGIYPDSDTNYYEETFNEFGTGFLAEVSTKWETAALQFKQLNINVSLIRIGIVLSNNGGALPKLVAPIKNFVGAALGKGSQWQSWIHIEDLSKLFLYIIDNKLEGVFNGVAPNPVKQRELVKAIGKTVNRPIVLPKVPSVVLKLILGEMSAVVLESQRVSSQKVENLGFQFTYHHLQPALEDLL
ncbi:TIGR01777 family oxidoreductase [Flavobacteriaceae bacterium S0825]|uniref:TIGR01777 family oxidoreductase n=1 Tax=Gaetbulibacter sp. S0825 TaxID=2720084 RepID=UPI001430AA8C|nr:TIGR01777 family oxidoreductase [Gaetbulibacter sp. S0825]MCK0108926.1 TIGR01777 family oxidoreductase [Flavobacteriaceae bacterium S0825]NIX64561.1 TIGR01777 family protein [Gaetbulibacter sp. S0825]